MSNSKISALTSATTPLAGTETLPVVQSSATKQVSVANLTAGRAVSMLSATAGNIQVSGNTVASTDTNGNINLTPNGTGAVVTGNYATVGTGSGFTSLKIQSSAGGGADVVWNTGTSNRWILEKAGAESGSNAGSDLYWYRYTDAGGYLGLAYLMNRSTGDFTNYSNFIQGTAAKGINFTANTPAAGMTSQLLNWYEEGTWTVAWTSVTGTPSNTTGYYTRIGRVVTFSYAAGANSLTGVAGTTRFTLPFNPGKYSAGSIASQLGTVSGSLEIDAGDFKAYPTSFSSTYMIFAGSYMI
jgi:hypothetical protein